MPEIAPSPDFGSNMEKLFTERSMVLQAWGAYGILWPVVHYQLGVSPGPRSRPGQRRAAGAGGSAQVSGRHIRLGSGAVDVTASRSGQVLRTVVRQSGRWQLTIGAVLPQGAQVASVRLDGRAARLPLVTHGPGPPGASPTAATGPVRATWWCGCARGWPAGADWGR